MPNTDSGTATHREATANRTVVVGGGLGGLVAAVSLAREGCDVTLLERGRTLGGRARSELLGDATVNLGPHALYRAGRGAEVLESLGVSLAGRVPAPRSLAFHEGRLVSLPVGVGSILTTELLGAAGKAEIAYRLGTLPRIDLESLRGVSIGDWVRDVVRDAGVGRLFLALARLTTYAAEPESQSAAVVLRQLGLAARGNVIYLDGGWQSLVAGLGALAARHGVDVRTGASVASLRIEGGAVRGVVLRDGTVLDAAHVILATGPEGARALIPAAVSPVLRRWTDRCVPARVACLDLVLESLPRPDRRFVLGIDRPTYFSVHSDAARLSEGGDVVLHVAKYLGADREAPPAETRAELEAFVDLVQPGWRERVRDVRFRPTMVAAHDVGTAEARGLAAPETGVPGLANLDLVGDWVGVDGVLADATLGSAAAAASRVLERLGRSPACEAA